jgi:Holliday junction resolvase RusA-like endonuclease
VVERIQSTGIRPVERVDFFVPGLPAPGGSKRAFAHRSTGRIVVVDDSGERGKSWRDRVAAFAREAWPHGPMAGPLDLNVTFALPRPKWHYGSGRNARTVRNSAPYFPTSKPDATKLLRALEDALTGILWSDDAQIIFQHISKVYNDEPGARVVAYSMSSYATVGERRAADRRMERPPTIGVGR